MVSTVAESQMGSWPQVARRGGVVLLGVLACLPVCSFAISEPGLIARLVPVAMALGAALNPAGALLVCAGLLPISGPLGALIGSSNNLGEPVTLAFLGGWLVGTAFRPPAGGDPVAQAVVRPAALLGVVVAASCAVQLFVTQLWVDYPWPFLRTILAFVARDYFRDRSTFDVVAWAYYWLEGLGLLAAAIVLARRRRDLGYRILAMTAAGAAGVAVLSLNRLVTVSLRSGMFWRALRSYAQDLRISAAFPDYNAAGSYLAMGLLVLVGLSVGSRLNGARRPGVARLAWMALVPVVAASLWLTGSRAALAAVAPGAVLLLPVGRRWRRSLAVGGAVLALVAGFLSMPVITARFNPPEATGRSLQNAIGFRRLMALGALHLAATHPVFGVGAGTFPAYSTDFIEPILRPTMPRENAHNNLLQLAAELGLAGFVPFAWVLVAVAGLVGRDVRAGPVDGVLVGAAGGIVAFCLTALAGQPWLVEEPAFAFWTVLGAVGGLAGSRLAPEVERRFASTGRWRYRLVSAAMLVTLASIPVRGHSAVAEATLDTASIGLSGWEVDATGDHYRTLLGPAQFFVPTNAAFLRLPVRLETGARETELEIRLDGQLANRVRVQRSAWTDIETMLPADRQGRRYRPVQVAVTAPPSPKDPGGPTGVQLGLPAYTARR
jgi:O-antigen ligase